LNPQNLYNSKGTEFNTLSDGVIDKMRSLGLPDVTESEASELILIHLRAAITKFKACKQDLGDRDDILGYFNFFLTNEEVEILVTFLTIEYLTANFINVPSLLRQSLPSKDFQVFSKRNHLDGLVNLRDTYNREVRQMVSIYSNQGSDLFSTLLAKRNKSTEPDVPEEV
jgi:hypothetical protein